MAAYSCTPTRTGKSSRRSWSPSPLINPEARQFARFFLSGAQYVTVDKQGRILMPQDLREFAGLEKDVVLAGTGGRIEIWSLEKWDEINSQADINTISQGMMNLGLTI